MGRLGSNRSALRPIFKVHYRKLMDDYGGNDSLSFVPPLPDYLSYCCCRCGHTQKLKTDELNSIVGNAFRMAYAAQLHRQPNLQDVISSHLQEKISPDSNDDDLTPESSMNWNHTSIPHKDNSTPMNLQINGNGSPSMRLSGVTSPPNSIPGLNTLHSYKATEDNSTNHSNQSTPSSEESNSPTELNSCKRLIDKPPLIKRIAIGLTSGMVSGCMLDSSRSDDMYPLMPDVSSSDSGPLSGGYVNEAVTEFDTFKSNMSSGEVNHMDIPFKLVNNDNDRLSESSLSSLDIPFEPDWASEPVSENLNSSSAPANGDRSSSFTRSERIKGFYRRTPAEDAELKAAPWFQAGIPREITLEVLSEEPVGSFMVRESTSKPGCYALSVRVPREAQASGIAHYLIMRTNKGYKIKGFTKEFTTLTALITHHSVMQELLPCPLSLSRYSPRYGKHSDSKRDFGNIDPNRDYPLLSDISKMMADLKM